MASRAVRGVIDRLVERHDMPIVLIGSPADRPYVVTVADRVRGNGAGFSTWPASSRWAVCSPSWRGPLRHHQRHGPDAHGMGSRHFHGLSFRAG